MEVEAGKPKMHCEFQSLPIPYMYEVSWFVGTERVGSQQLKDAKPNTKSGTEFGIDLKDGDLKLFDGVSAWCCHGDFWLEG